MPWPLSQDYNEAVQTPPQSFSDADLKQTEAKCNAIGIPMPCSGNFADVHEMTGPGGAGMALNQPCICSIWTRAKISAGSRMSRAQSKA